MISDAELIADARTKLAKAEEVLNFWSMKKKKWSTHKNIVSHAVTALGLVLDMYDECVGAAAVAKYCQSTSEPKTIPTEVSE